jgi:tRNA(His) guanylyltransferase
MKDDLGNRMKDQYENRTRFLLPRRTWTVIRVDGKAFHTFTRDLEEVYDLALVDSLNYAATKLCEEAQGALFAYLQSDEISVVLQDFKDERTQAWFDGNVQKIASVSASIVTARFNQYFNGFDEKVATFDARVFTIPDPIEVENYFIWRQKDATRNSIQSLGRAHFSHHVLEGKNCGQIQDLLFHEKKINWNDCPTEFKRGRVVERVYQNWWEVNDSIPVFTEDRTYLRNHLGIKTQEA